MVLVNVRYSDKVRRQFLKTRKTRTFGENMTAFAKKIQQTICTVLGVRDVEGGEIEAEEVKVLITKSSPYDLIGIDKTDFLVVIFADNNMSRTANRKGCARQIKESLLEAGYNCLIDLNLCESACA